MLQNVKGKVDNITLFSSFKQITHDVGRVCYPYLSSMDFPAYLGVQTNFHGALSFPV